VGTLLLLALTLTAFAVHLWVFMARGSVPSEQLYAVIRVENRGGELVVIHEGGDEIPKAFKLYNGAVTWLNLVVKRNGENLNVTGGARAGNLTTGMVDFGPGTKLELPVSVGKGDRITVVYFPAGQILCEREF